MNWNPNRAPIGIHRVRLLAFALFFALFFAQTAVAWAEPKYVRPDFNAIRHVSSYLSRLECPKAVEELKAGVKSKQPDVLLLAGTLFEEGLCVKQNWEKAANLYELAHDAGNFSGIPRLVAGYAIAGRDNGLALWWAAQRPAGLPSACIPKADPRTDPEGFNAALERMPAPLFQGCVYSVGVASDVIAETYYPPEASRNGVSGDLLMEFVPSSGTITWKYERFEIGRPAVVRDLAKTQFDHTRAVENSLMSYLTKKGESALARYKKPEGIDPSFKMHRRFIFNNPN